MMLTWNARLVESTSRSGLRRFHAFSSIYSVLCFFFSSRRRHTRCSRDWSSDVCSSDLLEKLLNSDGGGYRGAHLDCSQGHAAEFVGYRDKEILTVVSSVEARRAYYHCQECQSGFAPKDKELDVVGSSFSPGVRRMMAR